MKRVVFLMISALAVSTADAGLFDGLFANSEYESSYGPEMYYGDGLYGASYGYPHAVPCEPCHGWHPRPCVGHRWGWAHHCWDKSACQKSHKGVQKHSQKYIGKSAPSYVQKFAPKYVQKHAPVYTQKAAPMYVQKQSFQKGAKCGKPRHFWGGLHLKRPVCKTSKCAPPVCGKAPSKCHRPMWGRLHSHYAPAKGKGKGKGYADSYSITPLEGEHAEEVDLGEPPAPSDVDENELPADARSASLRPFPEYRQLLPIRIGS